MPPHKVVKRATEIYHDWKQLRGVDRGYIKSCTCWLMSLALASLEYNKKTDARTYAALASAADITGGYWADFIVPPLPPEEG